MDIIMKRLLIYIALFLPFTIGAQELEAKPEITKIGLVINDNEFATSLEAKCFELFRRQDQLYLQEISMSKNLDISRFAFDGDNKAMVRDYFISEEGNVKINDEILLSKEQSQIIESLLRLSRMNLQPSVSTAPELVFISDDKDNSAVLINTCESNMLYKALTTSNRRAVKKVLKDLLNEESKYKP